MAALLTSASRLPAPISEIEKPTPTAARSTKSEPGQSIKSKPSGPKVEITLANEDRGHTKAFRADAPKLYTVFRTQGLESGNTLRGVWIAEDVGSIAPANIKIDEKTLTAEGATDDGQFTLSKPTKGWPAGNIAPKFTWMGTSPPPQSSQINAP